MNTNELRRRLLGLDSAIRPRLRRLKARGCSCQEGDDTCLACQAEEMLDSLDSAVLGLEVKEPDKIGRFEGPFRWLSNFWEEPFEYLTDIWPSAEHAYQAMKTQSMDERDRIREAPTPGAAKKLGSRCTLRPGWDGMRVAVMREVVRAKFAPGSKLARWLIDTGDAVLIEGNDWGDTFWGQVNGVGDNWLGRILADTREQLLQKEDVAYHKAQLEEVLRHRKGAKGHFCPEWDYLYIEEGDPEFEACTCYKEGS